MQSYLGIVPPNDAEGVLQDVHWSFGAFGYFPTYALGNLYAAQLYDQAHRDIQDLDAEIEGGRLTVLKKWLNQKIHRWGRMFTAEHLMQRVTGQALNPEPFLEQLEKKYGELYEL
jgi:carboxypeptidase Taq